MTTPEIQQWILGMGRTPADRIRAVADLLRHANEDRMVPEDVRICRSALEELQAADREQLWREHPDIVRRPQ